MRLVGSRKAQDDGKDRIRRFPCWRYWVGLGHANCDYAGCPNFSKVARGQCRFMGALGLPPGAREYSPQEISACLEIPVDLAEGDIQRALVKGSRKQLVDELADARLMRLDEPRRSATTTSVAKMERHGM